MLWKLVVRAEMTYCSVKSDDILCLMVIMIKMIIGVGCSRESDQNLLTTLFMFIFIGGEVWNVVKRRSLFDVGVHNV